MFIAIHAKADINTDGTTPSATTKKGKLTPAQASVMNVFSFPKWNGILNFGGKCEASARSAINNKVDVVFNNGFFMIYGRLIQVEQDTIVPVYLTTNSQEAGAVIPSGAPSVPGKIVARLNLSASGEDELKVFATTEPLRQDDLNNNITGIYDFELYSYTATSQGVTLSSRDTGAYIVPSSDTITDIYKNINKMEHDLQLIQGYGQDFTDDPNELTINSPLFNYKRRIGTIEARFTSINTILTSLEGRLNNLGFKEGSVTGISGATLTKMGKYAILSIPNGWKLAVSGKATMSFTALSTTKHHISGSVVQGTGSADITITISGNEISWSAGSSYNGAIAYGASIGFEIKEW